MLLEAIASIASNRLVSLSARTNHTPTNKQTTFALKRSPKRLKYASQRQSNKKGDKMLYVEMDPLGADTWKLEPVIDMIKDGAVGVIPTDTVYSIVCDLRNNSAIERLRIIKEIEHSKPLSILCHSLQDIDKYTMGFPRGNAHGQTNIFRAVKHCLPGPYTFILPASKELPKQCTRYGAATKLAHRKQVGVRIPDDAICQAILRNLDAPLISSSVKCPTENQWILDPVIIADIYEPEVGRHVDWINNFYSVKCPTENQWILDPVIIADIYEPEGLDFIVDGGTRIADPSTVVDMTGNTPTIIRQGKGPKLDWMVYKDDDTAAPEDLVLAQ